MKQYLFHRIDNQQMDSTIGHLSYMWFPTLYIGLSPHEPILFAEFIRNVVSEHPINKNKLKIYRRNFIKLRYQFNSLDNRKSSKQNN